MHSLIKQIWLFAPALLLTLAGLNPCEGAFVLSFSTTNPDPIAAGNNGTVDVLIRSDAGTTNLDQFLARVVISGGPAGGLVFSAVQPDTQLADPNYVFFGNSFSQNNAIPIGSVDPMDAQIYNGADATNNLIPVSIGTTDQLLYRLSVSALLPGNYTIGLVPGTIAAPTGAESSAFDSGGFAFTGFSSTNGTITVNGNAAIPEPSTMLGLGLLGSGLLLRRMRNRNAKVCAET